MYVMRLTNKGKLFFIYENSFNQVDGKLQLFFDVTYLNTNDSASIKMTIYESSLVDVDSIALSWDNNRIICAEPSLIYKEKKNKLWEHRYDCMFLYHNIMSAFICEKAPKFTIYVGNNMKQYTLSDKEWKKLHMHMSDIFMIIQSNVK